MKINKTLILGINLGDFGSTGSIMRNTLEYASKNGNYDYLVVVPHSINKPNTFSYCDKKYSLISSCVNRIFKLHVNYPNGFYHYENTFRIIKKIKQEKRKYKKVILYLNNVHSAFIDIRILFSFIAKNKDIKVFYTLHDTWCYTGGCYCYHFIGCDAWQTGCNCKCLQNYDKKYLTVKKAFEIKRNLLLKIKDQTTLVTVSKWLYDEVKKSFLKDFDIVLSYGECNFSKTIGRDETLKKNLGLDNKKIILSIAAYWNDWKGYKYLYEIASKLPHDCILLIIGGEFDCKNFKNIIHLNEIDNNFLANYYSIADVYISTSQSETLGLTTCEAQICGVPVVCFGHTAIKETITDKSGYIVGESNNTDLFVEKIIDVLCKKPFKKDDIISSGMRFAKYEHAKRMFSLFEKEKNEKEDSNR